MGDQKPSYEQLMWKSINKTKEKVENLQQSNNNIIHQTNNNSNAIQQIKNSTAKKFIEEKAPLKIKMSLNKECKITLKPSNKQIAILLSKLPNTSYSTKTNEWTFDVEYYDDVIKDLIKFKIQFDKIPSGTLTLAKKSFKNEKYDLKGGIYDCLMNFQRDAVDFAINRNGRILLADDMGLGKTIQALAIANYYRLEYPLLILSPASLCYNWLDSVQRFLGEEACIVREKSDFGSRISVISYNIAVNLIDVVNICKYKVIICDECHYLKSTTSKRTKLLLPLLQKASRVVMISGTPATSRPLELYPIICALDKSLYTSFQVYGNRYCDGRKIGTYFDYRGCSNAVELSTVIEKAFMIRRLKNDVLNQLPGKFRRQILLETKGKDSMFNPNAVFLGESLDVGIMKEYHEASIIKREPVIKYVESMIEKNVKFLVFAHHKEMLDALESFCDDKKVKYIRIDGGTASQKRQNLVDLFQNDEGVRVAVLSLTACSTGLTLTSGKAVVFAELYWNPGTMLQAEDRIHRIGQEDNVDIHYLVAKRTIDEKVWPKLLKKLTVLESLGMSKNELKHVHGANVDEPYQQRLNFKKE
jgi:SWI/SNF-related matrix-associated actin-dependent regulator 1 of chromatin subfamily A